MAGRRGRLPTLLLLVLATACVVAAPPPATEIPLPTASPPPSLTPPASPTPFTIVTRTPASGATPTPAFTATPLAQDLPTAAPTAAVPPTAVEAATQPAATQPAATQPPGATATLAPPSATAPGTGVPLSIVSFTIEPLQINPGDPVTLTWETTGEQATLYRVDLEGRLGEFYNVPPVGSISLSSTGVSGDRVSFMLFAARGESTAQAMVSARVGCLYQWFFDNPPPACPAGAAVNGSMAGQAFERGRMLWTQPGDNIYVLYTDGASPRWDVLKNGWFPGDPDSDPSLEPPPGLYQPVRGFGVAWRTGYVSPTQVVRDRLGWATEPEYPFTGAFQCESVSRSRCFITGGTGLVYVLEPERSGWRVWTGP